MSIGLAVVEADGVWMSVVVVGVDGVVGMRWLAVSMLQLG